MAASASAAGTSFSRGAASTDSAGGSAGGAAGASGGASAGGGSAGGGCWPQLVDTHKAQKRPALRTHALRTMGEPNVPVHRRKRPPVVCCRSLWSRASRIFITGDLLILKARGPTRGGRAQEPLLFRALFGPFSAPIHSLEPARLCRRMAASSVGCAQEQCKTTGVVFARRKPDRNVKTLPALSVARLGSLENPTRRFHLNCRVVSKSRAFRDAPVLAMDG
jgi:hypothetical protein